MTCCTIVGCAGLRISVPSAITNPSIAARPFSVSLARLNPGFGLLSSAIMTTLRRAIAGDVGFAETAFWFTTFVPTKLDPATKAIVRSSLVSVVT